MNTINDWWSIGSATFPLWLPTAVALVAIWGIFWKGLALWHSAQRGKPWWFVIFLIVNTVGILEIIFLFAVLKLRFKSLFTSAFPTSAGSGSDVSPAK